MQRCNCSVMLPAASLGLSCACAGPATWCGAWWRGAVACARAVVPHCFASATLRFVATVAIPRSHLEHCDCHSRRQHAWSALVRGAMLLLLSIDAWPHEAGLNHGLPLPHHRCHSWPTAPDAAPGAGCIRVSAFASAAAPFSGHCDKDRGQGWARENTRNKQLLCYWFLALVAP